MTEPEKLALRYERAASIARAGVELVAVGDPASAALNLSVRDLILHSRSEPPELLQDVLGAARLLRSRVITQPQPHGHTSGLRAAATDLETEVLKLRRGVDRGLQETLDGLVDGARSVAASDPVAGSVLLQSLAEVGAASCIVICASRAAANAVRDWLAPVGARVKTAGEFIRGDVFIDQIYVVGPPRFFPGALVSAAVAQEISYIFPSWFADRAIPESRFAGLAEGNTAVPVRQFSVGETSAQTLSDAAKEIAEDELLPKPVWRALANAAVPHIEQVRARRLLLSGGYSTLLDDGERIRCVDPSQPGGERVTTIDVEHVGRGTFLLFRKGETEREVLYEAAMKLLGSHAQEALSSQDRWKGKLRSHIDRIGHSAVRRALERSGVEAVERVRAWTDPMLARPRSDSDFERLLVWLDVPVRESFDLATDLQRARARASAAVADQLQDAVGAADMNTLQRHGHLEVALKTEGFRGVLATRVLEVAPHFELVSRHDVRRLVADRGAKWLE